MKMRLLLLLIFALAGTPTFLKAQGRIRFDPLPIVVAQGDPPLRLRARGPGRIVFTSSNSRIARVNGSRVRILRPGRTRITARSANGTSPSVSRQLIVGSRGRFFGPNLGAVPNLLIGPETAPILDPISGSPVLQPSGQTSCTLRHGGYIGSLQPGSVVPGSGIIRNIRVRCGPNPAPMQAMVMSGSPGLYGTAQRTSRTFRPRANAVTTVRVDLRVIRSLGTSHITDAVGLNIVGPGTMPLRDQGTAGTFATGSALLQHWYPTMRIGLPENTRGYTIDGVELLMSWEFIQVGSGLLR
jgi:hypothetical protein